MYFLVFQPQVVLSSWLHYGTNFKLIKRNVVSCQEMPVLKRISHGSELSQLSEGVLNSKVITPP